MTIDISDINIGSRARKDCGDLSDLTASLLNVGMLHPVVVDDDNNLIAGARRLEAAKLAGWKQVPVTVVKHLKEALPLLEAERDENTCRKTFAPSEAYSIGLRLEALEKPKAEDKQKSQAARGKEGGRGNKKNPSGKKPEGFKDTREVVGKAVGVSGKTYEKIKEVMEASAKDPEMAAVVEEMDRTGNVTKAHRKVRHKKAIAKVATIPAGKFRVLYCDPPWKYGSTFATDSDLSATAAENNYPTLSIAELCALPVEDSAADDAVLFLWVTSPLLGECWPVIRAWGFTYKSSFVWDKGGGMPGNYNHVRHEFLLICTRGSCVPDVSTRPPSVQSVKREGHSTKPEHFRELIQTLYPNGPRLELFARRKTKGWAVFGNEV